MARVVLVEGDESLLEAHGWVGSLFFVSPYVIGRGQMGPQIRNFASDPIPYKTVIHSVCLYCGFWVLLGLAILWHGIRVLEYDILGHIC